MCHAVIAPWHGEKMPYAACRGNSPSPVAATQSFMLGDFVERCLTRVGITKDRVQAVVGRPCGCAGRQSWLNRAGAHVERRVRMAALAAARFYGLK